MVRYEQLPGPWKLAVGEIDGEPMVIVFEGDVNIWTRRWLVRLDVVNQRIERITDYVFCPWILEAANSANPTTT